MWIEDEGNFRTWKAGEHCYISYDNTGSRIYWQVITEVARRFPNGLINNPNARIAEGWIVPGDQVTFLNMWQEIYDYPLLHVVKNLI